MNVGEWCLLTWVPGQKARSWSGLFVWSAAGNAVVIDAPGPRFVRWVDRIQSYINDLQALGFKAYQRRGPGRSWAALLLPAGCDVDADSFITSALARMEK